MRRDAVLASLRAHEAELRALGVRSLSVFGSVARDEAKPNSDVDVLVEFDRPVGLFAFLNLKRRLSDWVGHPVDLVTADGLRPALRERVLREALRAA